MDGHRAIDCGHRSASANSTVGGSGRDLLIDGFTLFDDDVEQLDEFLSQWAAGHSVDDFTSQIIDDYDKDELNGNSGNDIGFGGLRDKLKL